MKATEFVKKFGWDSAKKVVNNRPLMNCARYSYDENKYSSTISTGKSVNVSELKLLVESYDLVEKWGGLNDAKVVSNSSKYYKYLKKAIADVESCL